MEIDLLNISKKANIGLNGSDYHFWLPTTNFGNFQLKYIRIIQRIDEANRRVIESYKYWDDAINNVQFAFERHTFAYEQALYLVRKIFDELISMISVLEYFEKNNKYPIEIKYDCIGKVINETKNKPDIFKNN